MSDLLCILHFQVEEITVQNSKRVSVKLGASSGLADRINTQLIYGLEVPDNFVNKHDITVTLGWQDSSCGICFVGLLQSLYLLGQTQ